MQWVLLFATVCVLVTYNGFICQNIQKETFNMTTPGRDLRVFGLSEHMEGQKKNRPHLKGSTSMSNSFHKARTTTLVDVIENGMYNCKACVKCVMKYSLG